MRQLLILVWLVFTGPAFSQQLMEIIPLRYRMVEQVLPSLQPFVEPGGALSGMNNQLIVRASRNNIEQIKVALSAIDVPTRRLMIRVSQNSEAASRQQGVGLAGYVGVGNKVRIIQPSGSIQGSTKIEVQSGDSRVNAQVNDSRSTRDLQASQSVQVVDGGRAFIQIGQSLPLPLRQVVLGPNGWVAADRVVYRDIGQGFYAVPKLVGERVTLEISPQFDSPGDQGYGSVTTQRLSTTVSGRLGEWIMLGGSGQQASGNDSRNLGSGNSEMLDNRSVWLRVEELP